MVSGREFDPEGRIFDYLRILPSTTYTNLATNYPIKEFQWGVDTVHTIKFNQVEPHVLGACASDRSIILYDIRLATPMRKVIMELSTNSIGMYVHA